MKGKKAIYIFILIVLLLLLYPRIYIAKVLFSAEKSSSIDILNNKKKFGEEERTDSIIYSEESLEMLQIERPEEYKYVMENLEKLKEVDMYIYKGIKEDSIIFIFDYRMSWDDVYPPRLYKDYFVIELKYVVCLITIIIVIKMMFIKYKDLIEKYDKRIKNR